MKFAHTLLAGAASLALLGSANAAGTWQGWYAGINAGYMWSDVDSRLDVTQADRLIAVEGQLETAGRGSLSDGDAATGGFQVGYNHDMGAWVLGAELDFNFANPTDVGVANGFYLPPAGQPFQYQAGFEQDWLSTLRLKLGFEVGSALLYLTGGGAAGDVSVKQGYGDFGAPYTEYTDSETLFGWTAGAGVELPISGNTTVKLEYLYVDLGDTDVQANNVFPGRTDDLNTRIDVTEQVVRVGLNIKL